MLNPFFNILLLTLLSLTAHSESLSELKAKQDCSEKNIRLMYAEKRFVKRNRQYIEVFASDWKAFKWACNNDILALKKKYKDAKAAKNRPSAKSLQEQPRAASTAKSQNRLQSAKTRAIKSHSVSDEFFDPKDDLPPPLE